MEGAWPGWILGGETKGFIVHFNFDNSVCYASTNKKIQFYLV